MSPRSGGDSLHGDKESEGETEADENGVHPEHVMKLQLEVMDGE